MLRLQPGSAEEHARWVLALNAAFLASGALPAGSAGGGVRGSPLCAGAAAAAAGAADEAAATLAQAVGDQRWSPAILFG